jgi:hypothetical protein
VKEYELDVLVYGRAINWAAYVPPTIVKALVQEMDMAINEVSYDTFHPPGAVFCKTL